MLEGRNSYSLFVVFALLFGRKECHLVLLPSARIERLRVYFYGPESDKSEGLRSII